MQSVQVLHYTSPRAHQIALSHELLADDFLTRQQTIFEAGVFRAIKALLSLQWLSIRMANTDMVMFHPRSTEPRHLRTQPQAFRGNQASTMAMMHHSLIMRTDL